MIFLTGASGQLGCDVLKQARDKQLDIAAYDSQSLNLEDSIKVKEEVRKLSPSVVIHCAAYTKVDDAEDNSSYAEQVNVQGTSYLAEAASEIGAKFIYISTDYVFDGNDNAAYEVNDSVNPLGVYGDTKLRGEYEVQHLLDKYFIVRISWVFGINGSNFVKTMLKLAETKDSLNVVNDQIGSPTYTYDLAQLLLKMLETDQYGVYHATNEGVCTWADFSREIFRYTENEVVVSNVTSEQFPVKASRPKNSVLSKKSLDEGGFDRLPHWKDALHRFLDELAERNG